MPSATETSGGPAGTRALDVVPDQGRPPSSLQSLRRWEAVERFMSDNAVRLEGVINDQGRGIT